MAQVSILMNCFNGAEYLSEAIDSVFFQTYSDWEIIFVDNCSTDSSESIAKSYGEKVRYFKTEENIPLGAARNFGVDYCKGEYIAFLDTDDIWCPHMLEKQVSAMESGDYALVYAGQTDINACGEVIGETVPKFKAGNILPQLLLQYDVPLVTAMVRKNLLIDSGLNFDPNVQGSEEYCLFMQLAVEYSFKVIPEALVKYRVLGGSLTHKTMHVRGKERRYTLDKILGNSPELKTEYIEEFREAYARGKYYEAQYEVASGNKLEARILMSSIKNVSGIYLALYLSLFFPVKLWEIVQRYKYGR